VIVLHRGYISLLGNGVETTGVEWVTAQNPPDCHDGASEYAVFINGLIPIMGAGWIEAAGICGHGTRESHLIYTDKGE